MLLFVRLGPFLFRLICPFLPELHPRILGLTSFNAMETEESLSGKPGKPMSLLSKTSTTHKIGNFTRDYSAILLNRLEKRPSTSSASSSTSSSSSSTSNSSKIALPRRLSADDSTVVEVFWPRVGPSFRPLAIKRYSYPADKISKSNYAF